MPPNAQASLALCFSKVRLDILRIFIHLIYFHFKDFHHIDLLAHFDRERIPERVVSNLSSFFIYYVITLSLGPC